MNNKHKIKQLISNQSGIDANSIEDSDFIEENLGITGDDAWELIELLEKEYNLNLSSFDFSMHFSPEAGSNSNKEYGYYPVSVSHLAQIANNGSWLLPERNEINFLSVRRRARITKLFWLVIVLSFVLIIYIGDNSSCN